eukprot:Em0005g455a
MVYSNYKKQRILHHFAAGKRTPTIAKLLREGNLLGTRKCVNEFLVRFRNTQTISRKHGSGGPTKITPQVIAIVEQQMIAEQNLWHELKEYQRRVVKPKTRKQELINGIAAAFWRTVDKEKCCKHIGHIKKVIPKVIELKGDKAEGCNSGVAMKREGFPAQIRAMQEADHLEAASEDTVDSFQKPQLSDEARPKAR